jgi:hypothetical protein
LALREKGGHGEGGEHCDGCRNDSKAGDAFRGVAFFFFCPCCSGTTDFVTSSDMVCFPSQKLF